MVMCEVSVVMWFSVIVMYYLRGLCGLFMQSCDSVNCLILCLACISSLFWNVFIQLKCHILTGYMK